MTASHTLAGWNGIAAVEGHTVWISTHSGEIPAPVAG